MTEAVEMRCGKLAGQEGEELVGSELGNSQFLSQVDHGRVAPTITTSVIFVGHGLENTLYSG